MVDDEPTVPSSGDRWQNFFEISLDIICSLDEEGRILDISDNVERVLGWAPSALLGHSFGEFIHPEDRDAARQNFRLRTMGQPFVARMNRYLRADGSYVPMSWSFTWSARERIGHCIGRDMSDQAELEAKINLARRMDAIGQLTGGVAHDFNNLLTIILGSSEALLGELGDARLRNLAGLILQAAERGAELTKRLLAFGRLQPLEPCAFDANQLLTTMEPLIARTMGEKLALEIVTAPDLRLAFADPAQTEAAIFSLCLNARDAMPEGGRLTVETANMMLADLRDVAPAGDYVVIRVSDTGIGIAPELMERIFEPFFTTKEAGKGSGLGLSMVYGFVQQSKGHIKVESTLGQGVVVELCLPASSAEIGPRDLPVASAPRIFGGSENILVVEDDDLVRAHVQAKLEGLGYQVALAANGADALGILERRDDIDLLFTDVVMPGGMNGRQLCEAAVGRWPWLRILYTSGYSQDVLNENGRLMEGIHLLAKPYTNSQLSEKIRQVLDEIPDR